MNFRTDLADEKPPQPAGRRVFREIFAEDHCTVSCTEIARGSPKETEKYILIEPDDPPCDDFSGLLARVSKELSALLPEGPVLIVGLGNRSITPDALGPKTADGILPTRHVRSCLEKTFGIPSLREVSVVSPGVLGTTGIEAADAVASVAKKLRPKAIVAIDALASGQFSRLCRCVQLTNAGIAPGSGIGSRRGALNEKTMGIPVFALGVPTVIDGAEFAKEAGAERAQTPPGAFLTLGDIDRKITLLSSILAGAINTALNPAISAEEFRRLTQC